MADSSSMEKNDILHKEALHEDADLGKEEAMHFGVLTPEEKVIEKKLRRKIDTLIMPLVVLVYLMNYIDRNNYAAAKLQGLMEDLGMSDTEYQLGLSILFVGYVCQVSINQCMHHQELTSVHRFSCKFHPICSSITAAGRPGTWDSSSSHGVWSPP